MVASRLARYWWGFPITVPLLAVAVWLAGRLPRPLLPGSGGVILCPNP